MLGDSKEIDEEAAKEWEHKLLQDTMDKELNELNKRLEQKEVWFSNYVLTVSKHCYYCQYQYLIPS